MREALKGRGERSVPPPRGIVTVRIDPATGELAGASHEGAVFESFRRERVPSTLAERASGGGSDAAAVAEKLF